MSAPTRNTTRTLAVLLALGSIAALAAAQETEGMSEEMKAQMEAWMQSAAPGEHHRHLEPFVGTWKSEVTLWMAPGTEPQVSEATAEAHWVLGGRFLAWKHSGVFNGMPFEGMSLEGYNNVDGRYEGMWADNFGTLMIFYLGQCSDGGKTRTMHGQFTDPLTGTALHNRAVWTWMDDNHFKYESYMSSAEGEFKNMEIVFTRG